MKRCDVKIIYPGERQFEFSLNVHELIKTDECLEKVFAEWNLGSNSECDLFLDSNCRSLSPGDFVQINDTWFQCALTGWNKVTDDYVQSFENQVKEMSKKDGVYKDFPFRASSEFVYFPDKLQLK